MTVAKYDALTEWLKNQTGPVQTRFGDLDEVVRGGLPTSARNYREWWANTESSPQARGWMHAGRAVEYVDLTAEVVRFSVPSRTVHHGPKRGEAAERTPAAAPLPGRNPQHDWHWEGNVQAAVVDYLRAEAWTILSAADTETKEAGIDVLAERIGTRLAVEVKGYPSERYMSGKRRGERKPTRPAVQARHWYAGALLTTMLTKGAHPDWTVALAFPDFPTYRSLLERTASSLRALDVEIYLVSEDGRVTSSGIA